MFFSTGVSAKTKKAKARLTPKIGRIGELVSSQECLAATAV
jgi:hypothetical protein